VNTTVKYVRGTPLHPAWPQGTSTLDPAPPQPTGPQQTSGANDRRVRFAPQAEAIPAAPPLSVNPRSEGPPQTQTRGKRERGGGEPEEPQQARGGDRGRTELPPRPLPPIPPPLDRENLYPERVAYQGQSARPSVAYQGQPAHRVDLGKEKTRKAAILDGLSEGYKAHRISRGAPPSSEQQANPISRDAPPISEQQDNPDRAELFSAIHSGSTLKRSNSGPNTAYEDLALRDGERKLDPDPDVQARLAAQLEEEKAIRRAARRKEREEKRKELKATRSRIMTERIGFDR
jgi:hypothetical protein